MRKLCLTAKFLYQEIRWNYGILRAVLKPHVREKIKEQSKEKATKDEILKVDRIAFELEKYYYKQIEFVLAFNRNLIKFYNEDRDKMPSLNVIK